MVDVLNKSISALAKVILSYFCMCHVVFFLQNNYAYNMRPASYLKLTFPLFRNFLGTLCVQIEFTKIDYMFLTELKAHFTLSKFGKPVLILGGYRHNMQSPKNINQMAMRWRCSKWSAFKCRATIITVDRQIVKVVNRHNHSDDHSVFRNEHAQTIPTPVRINNFQLN